MNTVDAAIFAFWLICIIRGLFRGPVNEFFSITGVLGGMLGASYYYPLLSGLLPGWMGSAQLRFLTCFLFIFICIYLLMTVVGIITTYLLHYHRRRGFQRVVGAGFGALKGILVVAVLLVPLVAFLPQESGWIGRSAILPYENILSEKMARVIPVAMHDNFSSHIDDYKQSWLLNKTSLNGQ